MSKSDRIFGLLLVITFSMLAGMFLQRWQDRRESITLTETSEPSESDSLPCFPEQNPGDFKLVYYSLDNFSVTPPISGFIPERSSREETQSAGEYYVGIALGDNIEAEFLEEVPADILATSCENTWWFSVDSKSDFTIVIRNTK